MYRFALIIYWVSTVAAGADPECFMNTPQLIQNQGFPVESHFVTTLDGYILNVFRIPRPSSPLVFLQHGLQSSSDTWLLNDAWGSLAFILSEHGYDVWLGNARGNVYNLNHTFLPVDSDEFWDFSFEEMAEQDLPVMLEHALKYSKQEKLIYIGHSQGAEMSFIEFSQNDVLSQKVTLNIALAPIARIGHPQGLLGFLSKFEFLIEPVYYLFGNRQMDSPSYTTKVLATFICPVFAIVEHLCEDVGSLITGFDTTNINETRYEIYDAHGDQSTSTKNIVHWAQLTKANRLQKFDYESPEANMAHYNQTTPPVYNMFNYAVSTVLVAGGNDWLADTRDVMWLVDTIQSYVRKIIFVDAYAHDDYVQGMNAVELVYGPIIKIMKDVLIEEAGK